MPFDPAWPQNGQNIDADRFRGQFAGLIDLINQASSITSVVVDAVNTLPPGTPATVSVNVVGTVLHFTFGVPVGAQGIPGGYRGRWPALCPGGGGQCDHAACGQLGHGVGLL